MGLTRIRAEQISDIDYKQSVRVIALENATLTGGAPAVVDGVNLVTGDRILVAGQSAAAENGLYQVSVLGSGSNGTWARTSDGNEDGEIQPGMVVMVTQGTEYADTPWKLVTNGVIEIGVTELTFEENYSLAFGNIFANGTAVVANAVSAPITFTAGDNIAITGNNTTKTVTFAVTGISLNSISNGTSNVAVAAANGNVTVGVNGTANVVVFAQNDITVAGNVLPSANVSFDLGTDSQRWRDIYLANSTIYLGNAQISANATAVIITNPAGGTTVLSGATPSVNANTVVATGNITGGNLITAGVLSVTGDANVGNIGATNANVTAITATGNANVGNLGTAGLITATGNITGGNLNTAGRVDATGNITGGNLSGTSIVGTLTTAAQTNVTSLGTLSSLAVTGNTTSGNFIGTLNGSGANVTAISATNISSGTLAQARLANAAVTLGGTPLTLGATVTTVAGLTRVTSTEFVGTLIGSASFAGTVTTAAQPNITSVGTLTSVTVTGNVSGGNLITAGQVVATGNITANNFIGNLSGTANVANFIFATESPDDNVTYNIPYLSPSGAANAPRSVFSDATGITFNPSTNTLTVSVGTITTINATTITVGTLNATTAIDLADNDILRFGTSDDWELFHDGTTNRMDLTVGDLIIRDDGTVGDPVRFTFGRTTGLFTATGNVTGGNLITAGLISATGNITGGNLTTAGQVVATGNITGGNINANTAVDLADNVELRFGSSDDVEFYFTGLFNRFVTNFANTVQEWNIFGNNGSSLIFSLSQSGNLQASGNITGANVISSALVSASTVTATGNVTGGNLVTAGQANVGTLTVNGGSTFTGNLLPSANVTYNLGSPTQRWSEIYLAGNTIDIGGATISADLETGSLVLTGPDGAEFILTGSDADNALGAFGFISAGNTESSISTTTGALTVAGGAGIGGNLHVGEIFKATGNVEGGNITTAGNVTANYFFGNVSQASGIFATKIFNGNSEANIVSSGGNLAISIDGIADIVVVSSAGLETSGTLTVTGNVAGGNIVTAGQVTATGNVTGGNLIGTNIIGTLTTAAQTNITSVGTLDSLSVTGNVGSGNIAGTRGAFTTIAGTLETAAQPNITSVGTLTALDVAGNAVIGGDLTVNGNTIYVNITDLNVQDPIIGLGRGENNAPLTSDDGKDRGEQLWYYTDAEKSAFIGYDHSANKLIAALDATLSNEIVTVNSYGNFVVGGLEAITGSFTGNVDTGNISGTTGTFTNVAGTLTTTAQPNVTSLGTLSSLTVTANVTGGNLDTAGQIVATGNISGAFITAAGNVELRSRSQLVLRDTDNSHFVSLRAPSVTTGNVVLTLPNGTGNANQVLSTNGAGTLEWIDQSGGGGSGGTSFTNTTVSPVPGFDGNFDLSYNYAQTEQEIPFEAGGTDPFGVSLGEIYNMMDPQGETLDPVDLGVLT